MSLDDDIKYAVNYYKDEKRGKAFSILLNLAELYLSIAGKMPEKKKLLWNGFSDDDIESKIFNLARQECILAFVKEKESIYLKGVEDGKEMVRKGLPSENPYPENIFLPIPKEDYKKINELLIKEMGYPLDRLSGNIGRELFEALHARLENNLLKKES